MIRNPKITVLMPVYNAERYLREAIDSILNQTFKDFEFLIINDASTDNSKNIILSYQDPRIRYYENSKNLGVAKTLNRGLKLAKGEYIARMDADDISLPNRLELQYGILGRDKNLIMVSSHFNWIDEKGNYLFSYRLAPSSEEIFYELQFRNCLGHSTVIFNKEIIIRDFGGYDEGCEAEDNDLWLRLSKKYKIVKLNKVLMKIRRLKYSRTKVDNSVDNSALIIAQKNIQMLIGKLSSLDIIRILAENNPLSNSPQKIKEALEILEEVNIRIFENYPPFLDKSMIKKASENKKNILRLYLLVTTLFNSRLGLVFKAIYKLYRSTKYSC